jgi:signal transduction histidine kinase
MRDPLVRSFVGFIAGAAGVVGVVIVSGVIVLPLGALVSWLVLRPTTRRLRDLTAATASLRAGNRRARVDVEGEDEVATLQADFNAAAADLEQLIDDLESERDTVGRLLTARRELLTAVSHELRTPVATLRAYLDASLEHWDGTPPATLRRDLEVMDREAVRLQRLIEDLFDLSRAEIENLRLSLKPLEIAPILRRAVDATRQLSADRSRIELVLDVPDGLPEVLADEGRLEQVVRNLLGNAVRHTPPGGVVRVSAEPADGMVAIAVEDTGEGIEPAELDRIWERFYRTDSARDRDHGGAGLGLALVKELTEAMGGRVEAASTPGTGSRFTVWIPTAATVLRQADDEAATGR